MNVRGRRRIALRIALVMSVVAVFIGVITCAVMLLAQPPAVVPEAECPTPQGVEHRHAFSLVRAVGCGAVRDNLFLAFAVAESVALPLGAGAGVVLARREMAPLCEILDRQRRFVADASHELRTPLTQLHTRAQLLARRSATEPPQQLASDLQRLVTGTQQLAEIVEDLLLSAQSSRSPRSRELVDLAQLAKEAVAAEDARAQVMKVAVSLRTGPGEHVVMGTASALRRVIASLLDNAMGHTPPGGQVVVSLDASHSGVVTLSVSDTGVGFAPAVTQRLFERHARGTGGRGRRFGLGLALAREVVESHQGRISASGRPGYGARFTVELPAARADSSTPGQRTGAAIRAHRRQLPLRIRPAAIHRSTPATSDARAGLSPRASERSPGSDCSARGRHLRRCLPVRWPRLWCDRRRSSGTEG